MSPNDEEKDYSELFSKILTHFPKSPINPPPKTYEERLYEENVEPSKEKFENMMDRAETKAYEARLKNMGDVSYKQVYENIKSIKQKGETLEKTFKRSVKNIMSGEGISAYMNAESPMFKFASKNKDELLEPFSDLKMDTLRKNIVNDLKDTGDQFWDLIQSWWQDTEFVCCLLRNLFTLGSVKEGLKYLYFIRTLLDIYVIPLNINVNITLPSLVKTISVGFLWELARLLDNFLTEQIEEFYDFLWNTITGDMGEDEKRIFIECFEFDRMMDIIFNLLFSWKDGIMQFINDISQNLYLVFIQDLGELSAGVNSEVEFDFFTNLKGLLDEIIEALENYEACVVSGEEKPAEYSDEEIRGDILGRNKSQPFQRELQLGENQVTADDLREPSNKELKDFMVNRLNYSPQKAEQAILGEYPTKQYPKSETIDSEKFIEMAEIEDEEHGKIISEVVELSKCCKNGTCNVDKSKLVKLIRGN